MAKDEGRCRNLKKGNLKRKKKKIRFNKIRVIICLLILTFISITIIKIINKDKPTEAMQTLSTFMSYINEKKYEEMYEMISESSKKNISKEEFITRNQTIYEELESSSINIRNMKEETDNDKTKITYTMEMETLAGKVVFANTVRLAKEDGKYHIIWTSNVIFPGLNDTDKIKIDSVETTRGSIYDRNGKLLAGEGKTSNIGFVPGKMNKDPEKDIEAVSRLLDVSVDRIKALLGASYVKENTFVQIANIPESDTKTEKELMKIAGIKIKSSAGRVYPYTEEISHLIGYVQKLTEDELKANVGKGYNSSSVMGKAGLEKAYEDRLRGLTGYEVYIIDAKGNKKKTITSREAKKGEDIKLTIDINIQKYVYQEFKDDESASIVLNPKTGEILAMCSTPTYNTNDFVLGMTDEKWQSITADQREPLYNRCTAAWVPGSSFKPIIAGIAISNNSATADEDFGASGKSWQKDASWGTYYVTTVKTYDGPANLRNGLVYSDNIYFSKLALRIGADTLKNELNKLGFNRSIDFVQPMTSSKFAEGDTFDSEVQLADTGYGQGKVLTNPLHMTAMYTAFVNDGNMIKPYIEFKEDTKEPEYYVKDAFTKEAANIVKEDLIQVIEDENGTAHNAKIKGIVLARKNRNSRNKSIQGRYRRLRNRVV